MNELNVTTVSAKKRDLLLTFLSGKKFRILRHGIFLIFFALLLLNPQGEKEYEGPYQTYASVIFVAILIACFYINMYVLIPRTLYVNRYSRYGLYLIVMVIAAFAILLGLGEWIFAPHRIKGPDQNSVLMRMLGAVLIMVPFLLPSTALKVFQRWVADSNRLHELERKAMESELKALRNQINPHFLFNMLNNVNVLIATDPVKAQSVVHKLSGFLRYYLYENTDDAVFLSVEINFINDFLNIEKLRRDGLTFKIVRKFSLTTGVKIPSNLLMTFVENAVKHGAEPGGSFSVRIAISITDSHVVFNCVNSKPRIPRPDMQLGVGLANVSRRLDLQFGNRYSLEIWDLKSVFKVTLTIPYEMHYSR